MKGINQFKLTLGLRNRIVKKKPMTLYTSRITSKINSSGVRVFTYVKTEALSDVEKKKVDKCIQTAKLGQKYFDRLSRSVKKY